MKRRSSNRKLSKAYLEQQIKGVPTAKDPELVLRAICNEIKAHTYRFGELPASWKNIYKKLWYMAFEYCPHRYSEIC